MGNGVTGNLQPRCDGTAERVANHPGLLRTLLYASILDGNGDVRRHATLALTKLTNSVAVRTPC